MTEKYIVVNDDIVYNWGITHNLLDTPLMLLFFTYFSMSKSFTQRLKFLTLGFLFFEMTVIAVKGYSTDAITIIMGPGLLIVFSICAYFFIRQTKIAINQWKATGKALIATALLFAYGCYTFIYLLYYVFKTHIQNNTINEQYVADTFLVYFIVTTISSLLLAVGIYIESKRIKKMNELKITRQELSTIYTNTKRAAPIGTAMLDFDKEQWN